VCGLVAVGEEKLVTQGRPWWSVLRRPQKGQPNKN